MSSYKFEVECPFCGFKQIIVTSLVNNPMSEYAEILTCDQDEGGCDKEFAIKWRLTPVYNTFRLIPND